MATVLTDIQIAQAALGAGLGVGQAVTAVAIALAESGGNPLARHVNADGTVDRGLWQINSYWHKEVPDNVAYSVAGAAQAMKAISAGGINFSPWSTFGSGAYAAYLSRATLAVNAAAGAGPGVSADYTAPDASTSGNGGSAFAEVAAWGGVIVLLAIINSTKTGHAVVYDLLALAIFSLILINSKAVIDLFRPLLPLGTQVTIAGSDLTQAAIQTA